MLKVSLSENLNSHDSVISKTWFDINQGKDHYSIVGNNCTDIDVLVINDFDNYQDYNAKSKIYFEIGHNYEHQIKNIFYNHYCPDTNNNFKENTCFTITNAFSFKKTTHEKYILHNDFLFNRTKAYYSNFSFSIKPWYHCGSYRRLNTYDPRKKTKIFVCLTNTEYQEYKYDYRFFIYRPKLAELITREYLDLGYAGNPHLNKALASDCDYPDYDLRSLNVLETVKKPHTGYSPAHNAYYQDTFISVYVETIETGDTVAITEKTYDPLIKGHFVFPFSSFLSLKHLKSLGFKLPDFIDYSYDYIKDDNERWQAYVKELSRLMSMPIWQWKMHWEENFETVIMHNQRLFFEQPYKKIDFNDQIIFSTI